MPNPFGLNVLSQPHIDRAALLAWVKRAAPTLTVVMDAPELAQQIRAASPKTLVVHRTYHQADSRWHEVVTPKKFLDAHAPTAANGVVCQVFNEPSGAAVFAATTWIEQLIAQCPPTMTLALPNFAVGNPSEDEILAGKYDRLLRAICGTHHFWALHEYLVDDPLKETPYFCGRFMFWQRRARQLGLPAPKIIITEHGRDIGGGAKDGWRDTGWSEEQYFARLVQARELYKPHGIPVAVYCYGKGYGWDSFNIEGAATLLDKLAKYEEQAPMPDIPAPATGGVKARLAAIPADFINIRHQPNGNDVGDLLVGDVVTYYPDAPVVAGGTQWVFQSPLDPIVRPVGRQNAAAGWVSLQDGKVVFETVVDPPPVEPEPPAEETVEFKASEVEALIAEQEALVVSLRAAIVNAENTIALLRGAKLPAPAFTLSYPVANPVIIQPFGVNTTGVPDFYTQYGLPAHEGVDFEAPAGTPVLACADGTVSRIERAEFTGSGSPYGIQIRLTHRWGEQEYETIYAHLGSVAPELVVGSMVKRGQRIGLSNNTGNSTGAHLHLSFKKRGATAAGEKQALGDGTLAIFPSDLLDPTPLFTDGL